MRAMHHTVNDYERENDHNTRNHNQFFLPYPGICNVKINFLYLAIGIILKIYLRRMAALTF